MVDFLKGRIGIVPVDHHQLPKRIQYYLPYQMSEKVAVNADILKPLM